MQVQVKHLIQFLQEEFNPDTPIFLDKDNIDEDEDIKDPVQYIREWSLFLSFPLGKKEKKTEESILIQN